MRAYGRTAEANRGILVMKVFAARDERGQVAVCAGPPRKVVFATVERAQEAADAILEINADKTIDEATQVPYACPNGEHFHLRNNRKAKARDNQRRAERRKRSKKRRREEKLKAMRAVVAPFLKHEPIRPLWAYYPQPPRPELRTWQEKAWDHNEMLRALFEGINPHTLADEGMRQPCVPPSCPSFTETTLHQEPVMYPTFDNGIARGPVDVDVDEFERTILATQAEYEKAMGVKPTVIDLPNWARGTILEQIAFNNGFTIADRRPDED